MIACTEKAQSILPRRKYGFHKYLGMKSRWIQIGRLGVAAGKGDRKQGGRAYRNRMRPKGAEADAFKITCMI